MFGFCSDDYLDILAESRVHCKYPVRHAREAGFGAPTQRWLGDSLRTYRVRWRGGGTGQALSNPTGRLPPRLAPLNGIKKVSPNDMPRKKRQVSGPLCGPDLIRVADGIVEPTPDQVSIYKGFYDAKFGVALEPEEIAKRLRHLASLYALLRGHERQRQRPARRNPRALGAVLSEKSISNSDP